MQVEFLVNGGVSLLLSPENDMEAELLKSLTKQQNDIVEIRTNVLVLNKTFKSGILISKKNTTATNAIDKDASEAEAV